MSSPVHAVEKLVAGGLGLVRDGPNTIFVPFVIPGERVRLQMLAGKGRSRTAEVIEIVEASPERVEPPCPLFGRCGGCRLQHVDYPAQLKYKREIIIETLQRIAGLEVSIEPAAPAMHPYHYRSRIRLQVKNGRVGFFGEGREFLEVDRCLLAMDRINELVPGLGALTGKGRPETIEVCAGAESLPVAVLASRRKIKTMVLGPSGWEPAQKARPPFEQVNPAQNEVLKMMVAGIVKRTGCPRAVELYAGAGNLTAVLQELCGEVTAVDSDPAAIGRMRERLGGSGGDRLQSVCMDAAAFVDGLESGADLVVLDPPRTGARKALPGIIRMRPEHIVYVSCDPATLARDAADLAASGYEPESMQPLDMFPQTAHLEAVAWFRRRDSGA